MRWRFSPLPPMSISPMTYDENLGRPAAAPSVLLWTAWSLWFPHIGPVASCDVPLVDPGPWPRVTGSGP
jgi:hypothetical protein